MNTCPDCKNDLVCHDQGECLRPTPETEIYAAHKNDVYEFVDPEWDWVVSADSARRLERELAELREWKRQQLEVESQWDCQKVGKLLGVPIGAHVRPHIEPKIAKLIRERNEAREQLASEKATRNAIIAKGIETERQLAEVREENARLREALADCASHLEGWHTMEALENARKLLTP